MSSPPTKRNLRDPEVFPSISRKHAEAIGYVVAHWSLVEGAEGWIIKQMIGREDQVGFALTAELNAHQRAALITTLLDCTRCEEWIEDWARIKLMTAPLRTRRNDAVHGEWIVSGAEHFALRSKAKGKLAVTLTPVLTDELDALSGEILDLLEEIYIFTNKLVSGRVAQILKGRLKAPPPDPSLTATLQPPTQAHTARAQAEARARKKARKEADRQRSRQQRPEPPPSTDDA